MSTPHGSILIIGISQKNINEQADALITQLFNKTNHPDILDIEPLEGKKSIGIDQIRECIKFLEHKPLSAKYKAIVVKKAYLITEEGQNALLKTLEEPPTYAVIILGTKTEKAILPTVISRCKKVNRVGDSTKEESENNPDSSKKEPKIKTIAKIATKSTGTKTISNPITKKDTDTITASNSINTIKNMTIGQRLFWAEAYAKEERETIIELLEEWVTEERKVLLKHLEIHPVDYGNMLTDQAANQKQELNATKSATSSTNTPTASNTTNTQSIAQIASYNITQILTIKGDLEKTNVNTRLALEFLVTKLQNKAL